MSAARPASLGAHAPAPPRAGRRPRPVPAPARASRARPATRPDQEALRTGPGWLLFSAMALSVVAALVLTIVSLQAVLAQGSFRMR
ncbi:MAG TPA: hypothetical protein VNO34_03775, partial [Actinomycetota bacterium]|nr:hypothetical protein [Actinomycetota bacterium]